MSKVRHPEVEQFYCYVLLDPRKPGDYDYGQKRRFVFEPFYVGKGLSGRSKCHLRLAKNSEVKNHKLNKIRKILQVGLEPIVVRTKNLADEERAFALERELIAAIGRLDLGTGPLTNLTDGGEGPSGRRFSEREKARLNELRFTEDVRERMRVSQTIRFSLETKEEAKARAAKALATLQARPEVEAARRQALCQYNRDPTVRKIKSEKASQQWETMSAREKRDRVNKQRASWANKSPEERAEFSRKCSETLRRAWVTKRRKPPLAVVGLFY
jgi:hypothetical protein